MQVKRSSMLPQNGRDMSTAELVTLAQAGDREAFDPLYRRFRAVVLANAARRVNGDQDLAEDIASEVWAAAMRDIDQFGQRQGREASTDADDDFRHWLFILTRWQVKRRLADKWREITAAPDKDAWEALGRPMYTQAGDDTRDGPDKEKLLARLLAGVDLLGARQRDVVRMRLDGLSTGDIAARTGLTDVQVRGAWRAAQTTLRTHLADPIEAADIAQLRAAAETLPDTQRQVAQLRLDGLSRREIAARTGLTFDQVRDTWKRGRDGIRRHLADPQATVRRQATQRRDHPRLHTAAESLPAGQCQVAQLRLTGMPFRQIATRVGGSTQGAKSAWRRAQDSFTRQGLATAA